MSKKQTATTQADPLGLHQCVQEGNVSNLLEQSGKKAMLGMFAFNGCALPEEEPERAVDFMTSLFVGTWLLMTQLEYGDITGVHNPETQQLVLDIDNAFDPEQIDW